MERKRIEKAWALYSDLTLRMSGIVEHRIKAEVGLTFADFAILAALVRSPKREMRMGRLSENLSYSPSRLSYLVTTLVNRGFVEKNSSPEDGRGLVAILTDEGYRAWATANEIQHQVFTDFVLSQVPDEEQNQLREIFYQAATRARDGEAHRR
ncbi:MAG: MarR family transcriptional regulator [Actinomycetaceae bacterium]|nr:MarR family transcriptional regulator [Actinomycetaceae bacterium]